MQNGRFQSKIALCLKKVCYKLYLCENCQQQSCNVFIGLSMHGGRCRGGHGAIPQQKNWLGPQCIWPHQYLACTFVSSSSV